MSNAECALLTTQGFIMTIITIDGPSGGGKSTVSRILAQQLGYTYLDTGAMYRAVGWQAQADNVDLTNEEEVKTMLATIQLEMTPGDDDAKVIVNGQDVSSAIRSAEMGMVASRVSALPQVRQKLTELQRQIGAKGRIVAEGRDMGTVVFSNAPHKFFLDASAHERAKRRTLQLQEKGEKADEREILAQIEQRDHADASRDIAPLKAASDAITIDSSQISAENVVKFIVDQLAKK